jgi:phosphoglycolate phosphatase
MLLIFDWDGTLCDSKEKITRSMQLAAMDLGWEPLPDIDVHNIIGLGLPEAILALYPKIGSVDRQRLREAYAHRFVEMDMAQPSLLFQGVAEGLERLLTAGHHLAIATGKSRKGLDRIFTDMNLHHHFHATRCADETASKPDPLMLKELLGHFSVSAAEAVMIGDTEYDMEMARRIDMPRVAVSYGAHHISRLHTYDPVICIDHFSEFIDWVDSSS